MADPEVTAPPIQGGRAYALARMATWAILFVWVTLVALILLDKYGEEINNLVLIIIGALGTLGGAAQVPNVVERLPAHRRDG